MCIYFILDKSFDSVYLQNAKMRLRGHPDNVYLTPKGEYIKVKDWRTRPSVSQEELKTMNNWDFLHEMILNNRHVFSSSEEETASSQEWSDEEHSRNG